MSNRLITHMRKESFVAKTWETMLNDLDQLLKSGNQWIGLYGDLGCGKTTLCRSLYEYLPISRNECIILSIFEEK